MFKDIFSHIRTIYHKVNFSESFVKLMPSDNPKVLGYLPPAVYNIPPSVYDQLMAFKAKRGLESVEIAVTVILSEYFGLLQTAIDSGTDITTSRLENLEAKCTSLTETVAELQMALTQLQASSNLTVGESETPASEPEAFLLQDTHSTAESINSPSIDQSESLEPDVVSGSQANQSESAQLPILEAPTASQSANNLSQEHSEALNLTAALSLSTGQKDLGERGGEISYTAMTQANLAKRLGVATSTVSRMQSKSNFAEWSQQRDPDSITWVKSPDTKLFYPQTNK